MRNARRNTVEEEGYDGNLRMISDSGDTFLPDTIHRPNYKLGNRCEGESCHMNSQQPIL